jgi:hypothetical protein
MKTTVIILSAIGLLSLNSCQQETDPQVLMKNPETRTEVFNVITENQDYMSDFMDQMQNSEQTMQMMQGNKKMMGNMMQGEGMQMMMKDSMMMKNMMKGMMKDGKMMGKMMKMMHKNDMMSPDCMQSCTKMMGDKEMDIQEMNKIDNTDDSTKVNHTKHH